jgi:hypothetical protein
MVDISYRYSLSGGDQAKAELKSIGDAAETAESRAIRAAEARARKVEAVERELAKVRSDADKASAKASAALGGPDNFAVYQRRAAEEQRLLLLKREQEKEDAKLAARAAALVAAVDPLSQAKARYNAETEEAILLASRELITIEQRDAALRQSKATLDAATLAQNRNGASLGQQRAGYQQLGFQIQDITQQIALGTPPLVIMAQQAGQTASAIDLTTGASAGAAGGGLRGALMRTVAFMSGPWGAAVTGAALILGMLISKSGEAGDAADKLKDKQKSLTDRIKEQNEALRQNIAYQEQKDRLALADAQNEARRGTLAQRTLRGQADALREDIEANRPGTSVGGISGRPLVALEQDLKRTEAALKIVIDRTKEADALWRGTEQAFIKREIAGRLDVMTAETNRYKDAVGRLDELRSREAISREDYAKRLFAEEQLHARNTKAIENSTKATKENAKEQLSLASARKLVMAAFPNAIITSTNTGKHTTGSDHYKDRAIDFVPEGGAAAYTKDQVRAMLEARGISIRRNKDGVEQLFGPGDKGHSRHWHVAWEGSKDAVADAKAMADALDDMFQARKAIIAQADPLRALWAEDAERQAEIARLAGVDPARGGLTSAEARRYSIGSTVAAIGRANDLTGAEREDANAQDKFREYEDDQRRQREIVKAMLEDDDQRTQYLERQLELVGATDDVRRREMVRLDAILELQRQGIEAESARGQEAINSALAVDDLERAYERANALQDEFRQLGERTIDTVFDPRNFDDWGNAGKRVLNDLKNLFIELALLNPLKNALFGQDNPTLGGAGGLLGGLFGGGGNSLAPGDGALGLEKLFPFGLGRNAMGTEYFAGGLTLLGENGPEIASLPRGSRVTPSAETRRMLGRSAPSPVIVNQTLNVPVGLDLATKAEVGKMGELVYSAARSAITEERRRGG